MSPGVLLPVTPGDRILDLCAAPGGKATQLAARLAGKGVLFANDISASRGRALVKNLEMAGAANLYVTAETPARLALMLPEYFDAILLDAPCSGEGMFGRDESVRKDWLQRGPSYYQPLQAEILEEAAKLLTPGGYLLYSTCTFSREENEDNIRAFLGRHADFTLEELPLLPGFAAGELDGCVRIWPHRARGEGHFLALLRRLGERKRPEAEEKSRQGCMSRGEREAAAVWKEMFGDGQPEGSFFVKDGFFYRLPAGTRVYPGLRYLRTGLLFGSKKRERFLPSQALAMALRAGQWPDRVSFSWEDERVIRYLKGETVDAAEAEITGDEGEVLVCLGEYPLGWALRRGGRLKNRYPSGWRWL